MSGTGIGEVFIRNHVGFHIHALMKYHHLALDNAVEEMVDRILEVDTAGIISVDSKGRIVMRCNTPGMARAAVDSKGEVVVLLDR
jgi:beta-aspartyl-peptidase (threonine type)